METFITHGFPTSIRQFLYTCSVALAVLVKQGLVLDNIPYAEGMPVAKLFGWFDAIQETTVNTNMGRARWRTETIERDRLFLTRLGVLSEA